MAGFKDKFSKGLTTINVKTNNFMEQTKINAYISTLETEIAELERRMGGILYEKWLQGEFSVECVEELLSAIHSKKEEIRIQKERLEEITRQEQQILGNGKSQSAIDGECIYCANCGTQNAANYKFCVKCGSPLN